jgi:hypothetical protein
LEELRRGYLLAQHAEKQPDNPMIDLTKEEYEMENKRIYLVSEKETPAKTHLDECIAYHAKRIEELDKVRQRVGAAHLLMRGPGSYIIAYEKKDIPTTIEGVKFDSIMAKAAVDHKLEDVKEPRFFRIGTRTKKGKELAGAIFKWGSKQREHAQGFFKGETAVVNPRKLTWPMFYSIEDEKGKLYWIVTIHKDSKAEPLEGLEEIKLSRYYALQGR